MPCVSRFMRVPGTSWPRSAWGGAVYVVGNGLWLPNGFGINAIAVLFQGMYAQGVIWLWVVPPRRRCCTVRSADGVRATSTQPQVGPPWTLGAGAARGHGHSTAMGCAGTRMGASYIRRCQRTQHHRAPAIVVNVNKTMGDREENGGTVTPSSRVLRLGTWFLLIAGVQAALQPLTIIQGVAMDAMGRRGAFDCIVGCDVVLVRRCLRAAADVAAAERPLGCCVVHRARRSLACHLVRSRRRLFTIGLWLSGTLQILARNTSGPGADLAVAAGPGLLIQAAGMGLFLVGQAFLAVTVVRAAVGETADQVARHHDESWH